MSAPILRYDRKMARHIRKLAQIPKCRQEMLGYLEELERRWLDVEGMISRGENVERARAILDTAEHNIKILRDALSEVAA